jgi:cytochrome o ubiquinol oxidase subunit II
MGRNVQYSGRGFADQQFDAIATSTKEDFQAWVAKVKASPNTLDAETYEQLAKPSAKVLVTYHSGVESNLFDKIIAKWRRGGNSGMRNGGDLR